MFFADLHIHSKFERTTGKGADLEHMALWTRKNDATVLDSGNLTHPQWMRVLREKSSPPIRGCFGYETIFPPPHQRTRQKKTSQKQRSLFEELHGNL